MCIIFKHELKGLLHGCSFDFYIFVIQAVFY